MPAGAALDLAGVGAGPGHPSAFRSPLGSTADASACNEAVWTRQMARGAAIVIVPVWLYRRKSIAVFAGRALTYDPFTDGLSAKMALSAWLNRVSVMRP